MPRKKIPSRIPEVFTYNPWKKKQICGSFCAHQKEFYEENNLTPEILLNDQKLFEQVLCQAPPDQQGKSKNGRCRAHGSRQGRKPINGKYTNTFQKFDEEELNALVGKSSHQDLNEELAIMGKFIRDQLPGSMEDFSSLADQYFLGLIGEMETAIAKFDLAKVSAILEKMKNACSNTASIDKKRKEVERMIKSYAQVFQVEQQNRSLNGDYIHREDHARELVIIFNLISPFIPEGTDREKARESIIKHITRGTGPSISGSIIEQQNSIIRSENQG